MISYPTIYLPQFLPPVSRSPFAVFIHCSENLHDDRFRDYRFFFAFQCWLSSESLGSLYWGNSDRVLARFHT